MDFSVSAVAKLRACGANAVVALVTVLPFPDRARVVCAFDIVEHVDDEDAVLFELSRVAAPTRRCCSPCRCILGTGRHSTIPSGTVVGTSRSRLLAKLAVAWICRGAKRRLRNVDPNRRGWSMSACGFSRINVSGDVVVQPRFHAAGRAFSEKARVRPGVVSHRARR